MKSDSIRLSYFGLPIMQSLDDFSGQTHISKFTLYQLSKNSDKYYYEYTIPKKNGGTRLISQPAKKLKGLQAWILYNILYKLNVSSSCKGFEKGASTKDNAEPHKLCNALLIIDLKDFFPSINKKKVYNVFKSIGYNSLISTILTNICTYNDSLPQGSPCSPRLANLISWKLDIRIQNYVGKRGITYTRYADDLSLSGLSPIKVINTYPLIKKIINDEGFLINNSKTRMSGSSVQKKITGLVLYEDTYGVDKKSFKKVRAKLYNLTFPAEQTNFKLLAETQGWLNYLNSVDQKRLKILISYIGILKNKNKTTLLNNLSIEKYIK